jgi:2-polyprenyl-3-methyl-5-hydroxy-6-metoxy-1,4-benzoquinol methylase
MPSRQSTRRLLPDQLQELWGLVMMGELPLVEFQGKGDQLLRRYRSNWTEALLLDGQSDLPESIVAEVALYFGEKDLGDTRKRCVEAVATIRDRWNEEVSPESAESVERFYNEGEVYIYDLMWWHTLMDDDSALGYVLALEFAKLHHSSNCLDFGSGVGAGNILFGRNGIEMTGADISSALLAFSKWRLELRGMPATFIDTKVERVPPGRFDMVLAMDIFEHLVDPVGTVDELWASLVPGGYLFGRFNDESEGNHPQHIVHDFAATLERMQSLGFVEVWRDSWLWGHQAFQRPS